MEDETKINPIIHPILLVLVSSSYCYFLVKKISKGTLRVISLLPILYLFSTLPWHFSSSPFGRAISSFFITWITSFKLLLFCFDQGPLLSHQNFLDFTIISLFPLKIRKQNKQNHSIPTPLRNVIALIARYELVPTFNHPYLATSLRDFWGRRWNRMSSDILRQAVYDPTREALAGCVGRGGARLAATAATLAVSGIMHEMVLYYITCGRKPTWEVAWFFLLHGFCMVLEAGAKRLARANGWAPPHPAVSVVLTVGFAVATCYWLLFLPVWRSPQRVCKFRGQIT